MDPPDPLRPGTATAGDAVVGVFARDDLPRALAATHRAGFGPHARVLDGARGDLAGQLRRAGLRPTAPGDGDPGTVLILVNALGRSARVAEILAGAGARRVERMDSLGTVPPTSTGGPTAAPPAAAPSDQTAES